jgi:hypothetical protein
MCGVPNKEADNHCTVFNYHTRCQIQYSLSDIVAPASGGRSYNGISGSNPARVMDMFGRVSQFRVAFCKYSRYRLYGGSVPMHESGEFSVSQLAQGWNMTWHS